jgi:hypothetical protein
MLWTGALTGGGFDTRSYAVRTDDSGNVFICGTFAGTVDFDPGPGTYTLVASSNIPGDMFVEKLNANGDLIWVKQFSSSSFCGGYGMAIDKGGNIYVSGAFGGTVDFDPDAGVSNSVAGGSNVGDAFALKLNSAGALTWVRTWIDCGDGVPNSLAVDSSRNVYIAGLFDNPVDFDPGSGTLNLSTLGDYDIYLVKLDSSGAFAWVHEVGYGNGTNDDVRDICISPGNEVILGGRVGNSGTVLKFDSGGAVLWSKELGNNISLVLGIGTDEYGNVLSTGLFPGLTDFDPGLGVHDLIPVGQEDAFVLKLGVNGDFIWVKQIAGQNISLGIAVVIDDDRSVIVGGGVYGTADANYGSTPVNMVSAGSEDIFILKFTEFGDLVYAGSEGGTSEDEITGLALDGAGNILLTGRFQNTADMDPGSGTYNINAPGMHNIFVQKLSSTVSVPVLTGAGSGSVYPSPSAGSFTVSSATIIDKIQLTDALGRVLHTSQPRSKQTTLHVDVPSGLYYLTIHTGPTRTTEKLLISK